MVQKEVAERLCAKSGQEGYGAITASIGYYGTVKRLFTVTAGNFSPKPKVDSAVVRLDLYPESPFQVDNEPLYFEVIKAAFLQRRKTLCNALASYFPSLSKESVGDLLEELGLRRDARGEMLTSEQFALIANNIEKKK
jgi:16S rRNA (adenine1518-N6/adenine1519-N6)-dimethyltransferase